jgi:hypothetical protein
MALPMSTQDRQGAIRRFLSGLTFPKLFLLVSGLFLLDLAVPDLIPFLDEIFLGAATVVFGMWRERRASRRTPGV